ncbi:MAG: hypothetical protein EBZ69_08625, partial [Alphaproteobacteria bacterium]|nr:hypothetical protein [Alphaproteobacteria bacterium]
ANPSSEWQGVIRYTPSSGWRFVLWHQGAVQWMRWFGPSPTWPSAAQWGEVMAYLPRLGWNREMIIGHVHAPPEATVGALPDVFSRPPHHIQPQAWPDVLDNLRHQKLSPRLRWPLPPVVFPTRWAWMVAAASSVGVGVLCAALLVLALMVMQQPAPIVVTTSSVTATDLLPASVMAKLPPPAHAAGMAQVMRHVLREGVMGDGAIDMIQQTISLSENISPRTQHLLTKEWGLVWQPQP